jgi:Phosphotransferase enzyme family
VTLGRGSLRPTRIPKRWEDVTPDWMTAAISSRHPQAVVKEAILVTQDDGTNRRARFRLTYLSGSGPEQLFLKAHAPRHRIVHLRNGNLFNEARLFKSAVPLAVDHPLVYTSIVDYLRLDFLLVMEDILKRGADPRDATRPMTVEQVARGLRGLARLHSQYWGYCARTHPMLRWVKSWKPSKGWKAGLGRYIPIGLGRGAAALPQEVTKYPAADILELWARYVASLSRGPATLLHGDAHIGNAYVLPGDDVGFLDWQVTRRGEWSQDVGYFLISALTEENRRKHEADLLEEYRRTLQVPHGQRPTADRMWARYRATPIYGLAIWLSTLGTHGWQPQEISLTLCRRFSAAFIELDTVQALESIES